MLLKRIFLLWLFLLPGVVRAQIQDTLDEAEISGKRITPPIAPGIGGMKVYTIDSAALQTTAYTSFGETLIERFPVFSPRTGVNGPATLSIRGASAAQSMVMWEGIPLQNPAMGMTDISLLQAHLFQSVNLIPGGTPALWGSGNVGGVLLLNNGKPFFPSKPETELFLGLSGGSFSLVNGSFVLTQNRPKAYYAVRTVGRDANYAFDFAPENGSVRHIDHARIAQYGTMVQAAQTTPRNFVYRQDVWWQKTSREIPPALFETRSTKQQEDESLRVRLGMEKGNQDGKKYEFLVAGMFEKLQYADADIGLKSNLKTTTLFARGQYQYAIANGQLLLDAPMQISFAANDQQDYLQKRIALAGSLVKKFRNNKIYTSTSLRLENIDGHSFILPGINAAYSIYEKTRIHSAVQRSYRAPSLSERYYFPGGNPDLKPEQGWSGELGLRQEFSKSFEPSEASHWSLRAHADATVFYRDIRDWIIWYGGAVWTPHNIARVQTKGIEAEGEMSISYLDFQAGLRPGWTYTIATTKESAVPNDGSVGKQIANTPYNTARLGSWVSYKKLRLDAHSVYTGYRFITSDESAWLPSYWLHNVSLTYILTRKKLHLNMEVRCNNLLNNQYLSVSGRPGLPRHFTAGIVWIY